MSWSTTFFITSILLGVGLAIDGFLISLSNGLNFNNTKRKRIILSAVVFALFQFVAVLIGWICVVKLSVHLTFIDNILEILAFVILCIIGIKMIVEGVKKCRKKAKEYNTMQNATNNTTQIEEEIIQKDSEIQLNKKVANKHKRPWFVTLLIQGLITSLDALSVGFVISSYLVTFAIISALIISLITFTMYIIGFNIGKKFGVKLGNKAELIGGIIFLIIGVEILITSIIN